MSYYPPQDQTTYTYLSIPNGSPFGVILEPNFYGYYWEGLYPYTFTIQGWDTSDDGSSVPSLPAGVTFNNQTSILSGTANNPTSSNSGNFLVTIFTNGSSACWYNIVNIDYNSDSITSYT